MIERIRLRHSGQWLGLALLLGLACLLPVPHAQTQTEEKSGVRDIRSLNATEKQQLLEKIRQRLARDFDATKPFPGQVAFAPYKLKFKTEASNEVLVMDFGPINGPHLQESDESEFAAQLDSVVLSVLDESGISRPEFRYEYQGHDWYYYYPEEGQEAREAQLQYERNMRSKGE